MTTPNRPPMTVWASEDINAPVMGGGGPKRGHWCSVQSQVFRHGPYVNLEQFMEEVERRAVKLFAKSFHTATLSECVSQSLKELAKEIQEGNG